MAFEIEYSPDAEDHLRALTAPSDRWFSMKWIGTCCMKRTWKPKTESPCDPIDRALGTED